MRLNIFFAILFVSVSFASLAIAGERQLYSELKKIEAATEVGVSRVELKRLLYPAAAMANEMGLSMEKAKNTKAPNNEFWLFAAYETYRSSSEIMSDDSYKGKVHEMWAQASGYLSKVKIGKKK